MATDVVNVRLSRQEAAYLIGAVFLRPHHLEAIRKGEQADRGGITLTLSRDLAEEFREAFTDQLAKVGFDQNYDATPEGRLLEELIDRFYAD